MIADALSRIMAQRRYPELARRRGVEGRVRIGFHVDGTGRVDAFRVVKSADDLLDDAAREAVERAAPLPPLGDVEVDVDFHLD
jgi:protein TonB